MPQIWLTYDELSHAFGVPRNAVRDNCAELGLARMRNSDGLTRVRLSEGMAHQYLVGLIADRAGEARGARHEQLALGLILRDRQPPQATLPAQLPAQAVAA